LVFNRALIEALFPGQQGLFYLSIDVLNMVQANGKLIPSLALPFKIGRRVYIELTDSSHYQLESLFNFLIECNHSGSCSWKAYIHTIDFNVPELAKVFFRRLFYRFIIPFWK
jgi:hypothetical protein